CEIGRRIAPAEALGWADGAVAALRRKDRPLAGRLLSEALRRAPQSAAVLSLEGTRRELAGDLAGAIEAFEKAASAAPRDPVPRWSAARLLIERGGQGTARAAALLASALEQAPANLFLLVRLSELERAGE